MADNLELWVCPEPGYFGEGTPNGPTPEMAFLSKKNVYRVLFKQHNDAKEVFFGIVNERGELWLLSHRYFRVVEASRNGIPSLLIAEKSIPMF